MIGVAMYGRGYKLQYPSINGIGAQALVGSNGNSMGPFTKSKGLLAYYEVIRPGIENILFVIQSSELHRNKTTNIIFIISGYKINLSEMFSRNML